MHKDHSEPDQAVYFDNESRQFIAYIHKFRFSQSSISDAGWIIASLDWKSCGCKRDIFQAQGEISLWPRSKSLSSRTIWPTENAVVMMSESRTPFVRFCLLQMLGLLDVKQDTPVVTKSKRPSPLSRRGLHMDQRKTEFVTKTKVHAVNTRIFYYHYYDFCWKGGILNLTRLNKLRSSSRTGSRSAGVWLHGREEKNFFDI